MSFTSSSNNIASPTSSSESVQPSCDKVCTDLQQYYSSHIYIVLSRICQRFSRIGDFYFMSVFSGTNLGVLGVELTYSTETTHLSTFHWTHSRDLLPDSADLVRTFLPSLEIYPYNIAQNNRYPLFV